tara:strand:- start:2118 stop:3284 length:1167 start_codon:yes stop_codon:yes gene_type:complete
MNCKIYHPNNIINCEIKLPSSKSISNRLLIIQSLCKWKFKINNLSNSTDTIYLYKALKNNKKQIDVGDAGTSFRFLIAYLSILEGEEFYLNGSKRLRERPIKQLIESLRSLGANIKNDNLYNFPIKITGKRLFGGKISINGGVSSQFISSLLLIAPILDNGLSIEIKGKVVSKPYINMTLKLMNNFGIKYSWDDNVINIKKQDYIPNDIFVESDWSACSFWFEIASLSNDCNIKIKGLSKDSIQGDNRVLDLYKNLGVESKFYSDYLMLTKTKEVHPIKIIDFLNIPDLYLPIACTSFAKEKKINFTGLDTLKDKESNRIVNLSNELNNVKLKKEINTYKDHRIAMSFAPLCMIFGELKINDINVVRKSYPNFWDDLVKAGFKISPLK